MPHAQRVDRELRDLLVREVCALVSGLDQTDAALELGLSQPHVSLLRRGRGEGLSVSRLLRLLAAHHYDIEVHLKRRPRPFERPHVPPQVSVVRFDRYGGECSRSSNRAAESRKAGSRCCLQARVKIPKPVWLSVLSVAQVP